MERRDDLEPEDRPKDPRARVFEIIMQTHRAVESSKQLLKETERLLKYLD